MINYIEKGIGLHEKIAAAGHELYQSDGQWVADDPDIVQLIIDNYTLDEAKAEIIAKIDKLAKEKRDAIVAKYSPGEMASWSIKRAEAMAYDGTPESAPMLTLEAQARGVNIQVIRDKVLGNGAALAELEAMIAGVTGKHTDAVKSLSTFEEVAAYDYRRD